MTGIQILDLKVMQAILEKEVDDFFKKEAPIQRVNVVVMEREALID